MKDRLLTLALAVGAFALFYALIAPKPAPPEERITRPLSTEEGPNGYAALYRWLQAESVAVESLRERYGELHERFGAASGTGHVLITTAPHLYPIRSSEVAPLREWVSAGNTLVVLAGLSDTPEWSMGAGYDENFLSNLESMVSLKFEQVQAEELAAPAEPTREGAEAESAQDERTDGVQDALAVLQRLTRPERSNLVPNAPHPLLSGVQSVLAISEYPSSKWLATATSADMLLELAHDPASDTPVLWLLQQGRGQIIVSAYGSLFTNKAIGEQDNARLLANIVTRTLGRNARAIIDDAHQGLVSFYDPDAFFGDTRLHRSIWWLLGLWLVFVLGPQRLRSVSARSQALDITSFVRATGGFMARVLKPAAAGRQLFANFFNDVRRQIGLPADGTPVWDWLHAHTSVAPGDIAQLRHLHDKVEHDRRVDLTKLHNLLLRIRKSST